MSNTVIVSEKQTATTKRRIVRLATGVSLVEHCRNEEILEVARVEPIVIVKKKVGMFLAYMKRIKETENMIAFAKMKTNRKRP